jgi:hypothetical protein
MFGALEATGSARVFSALTFVDRTIRSITDVVKKRVKRASGLLESIVFGIRLELVVRFRSIALNPGITLSGEKPGGLFFVRLGLY